VEVPGGVDGFVERREKKPRTRRSKKTINTICFTRCPSV